MNNKQLAHVWAQQTKRGGQGSHFFFDGPSIFSYGRHFEIARFVERRGKKAVLFTTRSHSMTTSRHKSIARMALRGLGVPVFTVPAVDNHAPADNLKAYAALANDRAEEAARSRTRADFLIGEAQRIATEGNEFAAFFGLRTKIARPELSDELRAKMKERAARDRVERQAADAAKALRLEYAPLARAVNAELWRRGLPSLAGFDLITSDCAHDLLRVRGDIIETSRGAEFPTDHGRRAFALIAACRERGRAYQRNGHSIHLGHFVIDSIDAAGNVRAGCHSVAWSEIERCASELGILNSAATSAAVE